MDNEQLLNEILLELESGKPVTEIIQGLPSELAGLSEMILLANDLRSDMHPEFTPGMAQKQFNKVRKALNTKRLNKTYSWKWAIISSVVALVLIAVISAGSLAFWFTQPVSAASLQQIQGVIEVSSINGDMVIGEGKTRILEGSTIRTHNDSTAELHLPDGSLITLEPDTIMTINKLSWKRYGKLEFLVSTLTGGISNIVVPLKNVNSYYHVRTPGGQVSVHGTEFQVYALDKDKSLVTVTTGEVQVENQSGKVDLGAGQISQISTTDSPLEPVYSFNYIGEVSSSSDDVISLDGSDISITDNTKVINPPVLNSSVHVIGHFDAEGNQIADLILPANSKSNRKTFTGTISAINDVTWIIGPSNISVTPETKVNGSPEIGSVVKVWFHIADDGSLKADKIVNTNDLVDENEEEEVTLTPQIDETPTNTDENMDPTIPVGTQTPEPRTNGVCGSESEQPHAVTLADRYETTYDVIMDWFCKNNGFGEIDLAYQLSNEFGKPVEEIFGMRESGMGWGQIRQELEGREKPTKQPKPEKTKKPH
jgi:hypothetical protein